MYVHKSAMALPARRKALHSVTAVVWTGSEARWVSRHLGRRAVSDAISVRMFPGDGIAQERCHLGSNYRARCGRAIRLPMAICESAMCNSCHPAAICGSATCASSSSQIAAARRSSRHSRRQQCSISVGGRSWSELSCESLTFFI